jgi:hypothetical protein
LGMRPLRTRVKRDIDLGMEDDHMAADVLGYARVFARCSPLHKQRLVTSLGARIDVTVGFCGDGANDCGALKARFSARSCSPLSTRPKPAESPHMLALKAACAALPGRSASDADSVRGR